jgi:hypothetical protein
MGTGDAPIRSERLLLTQVWPLAAIFCFRKRRASTPAIAWVEHSHLQSGINRSATGPKCISARGFLP